MTSVTVGEAEVAFQVEGSGDPFLLVHGSCGGAGHWLQVTPAMAERHQVVMPEYAGAGATTDPGGPLELDDLVSQVLGVADAVGADRFHLAGWSLGAVVSAAVAARAPDRVRSLGLVCGWATSDARMRFTFDLWQELLRTDRELFARYAFADGATVGFFELMGEGVDALVPVTASMLAPGSERHAELDARIDIADRLAAITAPTLVVGGVEDRWVPIEHSRQLAAEVEGARLVELDCGHLVPSERAADLAALLLEHAASA
jgi:3-oxoadipate enol-lactonase